MGTVTSHGLHIPQVLRSCPPQTTPVIAGSPSPDFSARSSLLTELLSHFAHQKSEPEEVRQNHTAKPAVPWPSVHSQGGEAEPRFHFCGCKLSLIPVRPAPRLRRVIWYSVSWILVHTGGRVCRSRPKEIASSLGARPAWCLPAKFKTTPLWSGSCSVITQCGEQNIPLCPEERAPFSRRCLPL